MNLAEGLLGVPKKIWAYKPLDVQGNIKTTGNLWIHQGGQGASGDHNALVVNQNINKGAGETGSIARFQQNGSDVVKITLDGDLDLTGKLLKNVGGVESLKGGVEFKAQGTDTFDERYSSRIKVKRPDNWDSATHQDFGLYIDIGDKNTYKNRFVIGGREDREKAFEVYDDGAGKMHLYGDALVDGTLKVYGNVTDDEHVTSKLYVDLRDQVNTDHISILAGLRAGGTWNAVSNYKDHSGNSGDPTGKMGLVTNNYDPTEYFDDALGIVIWEQDQQGNSFNFKDVPNGYKFHLSNGNGAYLKFTKIGYFVNIILFDPDEIEYVGGGFETENEPWTVTWGPESTPTEGQLEEAHLNSTQKTYNRASAGARWRAKNASSTYVYHDGEAKIDGAYAYFAGRDLDGLQIYERDVDGGTFVGTSGKVACNLMLTTRRDDFTILCVQNVTHYQLGSKYLHLYIDPVTSPVPYQTFTWKTDETYYCTLSGWF